MASRYALHVEKWKECKECHLSNTRRRVVFSRGKLPCDILCVGEAPGESENVLGKPFVGPAGKLLDQILAQSVGDRYRVAMTNLISCIPRDEEGDKVSTPEDECVEACKPRLIEFIDIANPKFILCVGTVSRDWFKQGYKYSIKPKKPVAIYDIVHPAFILRSNVTVRGILIQRCVITIEDAIKEILDDS